MTGPRYRAIISPYGPPDSFTTDAARITVSHQPVTPGPRSPDVKRGGLEPRGDQRPAQERTCTPLSQSTLELSELFWRGADRPFAAAASGGSPTSAADRPVVGACLIPQATRPGVEPQLGAEAGAGTQQACADRHPVDLALGGDLQRAPAAEH